MFDRGATQGLSTQKSERFAMDIVVVTRFWSTTRNDVDRLLGFIDRATKYAYHVVVAINMEQDQFETVDHLRRHLKTWPDGRVHAIPVQPWDGITKALNVSALFCKRLTPTPRAVLFQSVEVRICGEHVDLLKDALNDGNTLVAGLALEGHLQSSDTDMKLAASARGVGAMGPGASFKAPLRHDTVPWNTLALWDYSMLVEGGLFPAVADKQNPPGMEEVGAIVSQQIRFGISCRRAKLVNVRGWTDGLSMPVWDTGFPDDARRTQKHIVKMQRKQIRTENILRSYGETGQQARIDIMGWDPNCL